VERPVLIETAPDDPSDFVQHQIHCLAHDLLLKGFDSGFLPVSHHLFQADDQINTK
jgi:hypothetical protein